MDPSAGGAPLIPLGCMHRHPWEQLLLCAPSAALGAQQWHSGTQSGAVGGAAAAPAGADLAATRPADDGVTATVLEAYAEVLGTRVVFAAPQEHSRKPLLHDMLRKCGRQLQQRLAGCAGAAPNASAASSRCMKNDDAAMPMQRDVRCLELFARQLQPGWTCWGDEVLHFPTAAAAAAHATAAEGVVSAAVPAGCTKHAAAGAAGQLPDDGAAAGLPQQENGVVTFCADKGYHVMRLHGSHIDEGRVLSTASCSQIQVRP